MQTNPIKAAYMRAVLNYTPNEQPQKMGSKGLLAPNKKASTKAKKSDNPLDAVSKMVYHLNQKRRALRNG